MMKTKFFLSMFILISIILFSKDKNPDYVFPCPDKKICILNAIHSNMPFLMGELLPDTSKLVQKIKQELTIPFHQSVIKLNQCSRNLVLNTEGPNVLYLSKTQGGFPRHGLIMVSGKDTIKYEDLHYVDLVINERRLSDGALYIFSHELGHVMMNNIWQNYWDETESRISNKQHVSMGVTDYFTAFFEGWGEHFECFAHDIEHYNSCFKNKYDYNRITSTLWHSNVDQALRINATLSNDFIYKKFVPSASDHLNISEEEMMRCEHTSPFFNKTRLKNAQEMLSCEGVIATLFYKLNSNKVLQNNYLDHSFYGNFLISPLPGDTDPRAIFTPFENVILKNFWIWYHLQNKGSKVTPIFMSFLKEWIKLFPEDKDEVVKILIGITAGRTFSNNLGDIYEKMAYYGMLGDFVKFKESSNAYFNEYLDLLNKYKADDILIDQNIGPELWVSSNRIHIRTTLWSEDNKKPLVINLNTANEFEMAAYSNISLSEAKEIIKKRDSIGYFDSFDQAKEYGVVLK